MQKTPSHCMKNFRIRSFSGPYLPAFRLNNSKCGKIQTRNAPNTDNIYAANAIILTLLFTLIKEI